MTDQMAIFNILLLNTRLHADFAINCCMTIDIKQTSDKFKLLLLLFNE